MIRQLEVFHWALVVADFDQAAAQLGPLLGLTFAEAIEYVSVTAKPVIEKWTSTGIYPR